MNIRNIPSRTSFPRKRESTRPYRRAIPGKARGRSDGSGMSGDLSGGGAFVGGCGREARGLGSFLSGRGRSTYSMLRYPRDSARATRYRSYDAAANGFERHKSTKKANICKKNKKVGEILLTSVDRYR